MALIFCDGFDHYAPVGTNVDNFIGKKWDVINLHSSGYNEVRAGRRLNSKSLELNCGSITRLYTRKLFDLKETLIVGFAFKNLAGFVPLENYNGIRFYPHFYLKIDDLFKIHLTYTQYASTLFYTSDPLSISVDQWHFIEFKVTIGNPGVFIVKLDETEVINETGLNLINSSYTSTIGCTGFELAGFSTSISLLYYFDDLYICDTTGTENNDFLGDVRIDTILPNADGNSSEFTPSAGFNYECVDDTEINETDYVESNIPDTKDLYQFPDIENTNTKILAVVQNIICKKSDASSDRKLLPVNRYSSIDTEIGTGEAINGVDYKNIQVIMEQNPTLNVNWIESHVNNSEFGFKIYDGHYVKVNDDTHTYSAFSTWGGDTAPSNVGDGDIATFWYSASTTLASNSWLKIDFGSGNEKIISKIIIKQRADYNNYIWLNFAIDGSNDDSIWNTIYNATSESDQQFREWIFNNSISYRYWRLYYPNTGGTITGNSLQIAEWELYELQQS
jgi:hypothetical protein